jgi:predicted O-methyltransferase YrrM
MHGILGDINTQLNWVDQCTERYRHDLRNFQIHQSAIRMNGSDEGYGQVEADFLYCFVRSIRPPRIVQIGAGVSTAVCLMAAADEGYTPEITCIEPYPTEFLKREHAAGRLTLVAQKVEDVGAKYSSSIGSGDLFFVDSSHTLAPAGEVNLILLEAMPRIASGVYVHFHDIDFPYDYRPDTLSSGLFFHHETALLYAFLLMNERFEIAASLSMLHHMRLDDMVRFFPDMRPSEFDEGLTKKSGHYPSSIFLRRLRA